MNDAYLLELRAWAHSISSLTCPTPRGAPTIDRQDVLAACGAARARVRLVDGRTVADATDVGPELLNLEAGIGVPKPTLRDHVLPMLARATVEEMLSGQHAPHAPACHEAAAHALWEWLHPSKRTEAPNRIEDRARRARISKERMSEHIEAAMLAIQTMRSEAMRRFAREIASARGAS